MQRIMYLLAVGLLFASSAYAQTPAALQELIGSAKSGQTIQLPEGRYSGGATLPAGVSLKGAGIGKTIIDAAGGPNGLTVAGGNGAQISDLTICNAKAAGVAVKEASNLTLSKVRMTNCVSGMVLSKSSKARIENCVVDHGSYGIVINGGADCVVVNCTVANCAEVGISLAASSNAVVFNNCIAGSGICLNLDKPANVRSDHNLFFGLFVGQMTDQGPKKVLSGWQHLTVEEGKPGLDLHSILMPIAFKDAAAGDVTPITVTPWALDRVATGDWGTAEFAGVKAPEADMAGKPRVGQVDIGAVETTVAAPRTADGQFTVAKSEGVKSAGVFTKDGMLVSYLFQNLPLPAGKYSFWLPARDFVGKAIPAGEYEVRLTESDFRWKYLNHVGDNGGPRYGAYTASSNPKLVTFAGNDVLLMQQGASEDHIVVRAMDTKTGKILWYTYGCPTTQGLAVKDGTVYSLIQQNAATGQSRLTRIDLATGDIKPWPGSETGHLSPILSPTVYTMAALGDYLYVADAAQNKLHVLAIADGKPAKALDVASPKCVSADDKTNLLWVVSGDTVTAIDATGKQVAQSKPVEDPASVSACNGKLAVASHKTGKVHIFDASDPANLKPLRRDVGKGDGPYGEVQPDRFFFQKAPAWGPRPDDVCVSVALNSEGQVGIAESNIRVSLFDKDAKNLWYTHGVFGNSSKPSFSTKNARLWDTWISTSFLMDEKTGTWKIEALWDFSAMTPMGLKEPGIQPLGDFSIGDKTFFVAITGPYGKPANGEKPLPMLMVARLDGFKAVPVLAISKEDGKLVSRKDTNKDGTITAEDTAVAMDPPTALSGSGTDAWGQQMAAFSFQRFNDLQADGSILIMNKPVYVWKCTGLDADGVPIYDSKNYQALPNKDWATDLSPYDFQPDGMGGFVQVGMLADGGYVGQTYMRNSGGAGLNNGAGTDLSGYGPDGRRRWVNQLAQYRGIAGMGTVDGITVTAIFYSMDVLVVDADGLGLGAFCEDPTLHYCGYWIDHPNIRLFKMADGRIYMTNGDNTAGRHNWYRLENQESMAKTTHAFTLGEQRAAELAALEFKPAPAITCPQPKITIKRLAAPMTIDGGLDKWRKAGVKPQIVMGPSGTVKGAGDASALIRMAYEGKDLYFQVLTFDDKPVFFNMPVWQNSVEVAINGVFPNGMQFVACKMAEGKDVVWRNRFFSGFAPMFLKPENAPCVVKVLDDAKDVSEREALESLFGEDLSKAKVIITEFKIPMDKVTYQQAENDVPELGTGKTFWVNFFIDDSDRPFTDVQEKLLIWPVGSGMFGSKEEGAMAVCE